MKAQTAKMLAMMNSTLLVSKAIVVGVGGVGGEWWGEGWSVVSCTGMTRWYLHCSRYTQRGPEHGKFIRASEAENHTWPHLSAQEPRQFIQLFHKMSDTAACNHVCNCKRE